MMMSLIKKIDREKPLISHRTPLRIETKWDVACTLEKSAKSSKKKSNEHHMDQSCVDL